MATQILTLDLCVPFCLVDRAMGTLRQQNHKRNVFSTYCLKWLFIHLQGLFLTLSPLLKGDVLYMLSNRLMNLQQDAWLQSCVYSSSGCNQSGVCLHSVAMATSVPKSLMSLV